MKLKLTLLGAVIVLIALSMRGESTLTAEDVRKKLQAGALLVDVRTTEEFAARSLPGAINLPVDTIKSGITNHAADKAKVVLLHCRTGRRSALAEKELRAIGYTNVFNLGSFAQAQKVVEPAAK